MTEITKTPSGQTTTVTEHTYAVEHGLLPAFVAKGHAGERVSLLERMRAYRVPGISIAIINHGQLDWARGYGVTRVEGSAPVAVTTLFQAGSISKPVAAMGALRLVQDGKLTLDGDVNQWLTFWKVPENAFTAEKKVTLRTVLCHSAGLTVHGFPGYAAHEPLPSLVQILDGQEPANTAAIRVDTVPGTAWRYSGGGYTIMQQLVVDVTHESFPQFMQHTVLAPLGMQHSTYEQPLPSTWSVDVAVGHTATGQMGTHTYPEMAAAGLWTTPSDLARFAIGIQQAALGQSTTVLNQAGMQQMLTPQSGSYGLGLALDNIGPRKRFLHGGVNHGFEAMLVAYEQTGQGAIVMANANLSIPLINEILGSIAAVYDWPDYPVGSQREYMTVDDACLNSYAGRYAVHCDGEEVVLSIANRDGTLVMNSPRITAAELFADTLDSFFHPRTGVQVTFPPGDTATAQTIRIKQGSAEWEGHRLPL